MRHKKINYNFAYIKKYHDLNHLLELFDNAVLNNEECDLLSYAIESCSSIVTNPEIKKKNFELDDASQYILTKFENYTYHTHTKDYIINKIPELEFNGLLLQRINSDFKLIYHFEIGKGLVSHYLIKSKKNKCFYHVLCVKEYNKKLKKIVISFNSIIDKISLNKIKSKRQFFNCVIKNKKDNNIHKLKQTYVSKSGVDYIKLYKENKI